MNRPSFAALLAVAALLLSSCGGGADPSASTAAPPPARPALAETAKRPGEILVQGQASPASHGPFELRGRYTARFEQIAPEDPELDFATQTPIVVMADRNAEQEDGRSVRLFHAAARTGEAQVTLRGRLYIDVSFGDFPYAIRLTPVEQG